MGLLIIKKPELKPFYVFTAAELESHIDWWAILGQRNNEGIIRSEITRVTLATANVNEIINLEIIVNQRKASIKLDVASDFGNINLEFDNGI